MKTRTKGALTFLITVILVGALALFFTACGGDDEPPPAPPSGGNTGTGTGTGTGNENPFKGTWVSTTEVPLPGDKSGIITLVVSDTTWQYTSTVDFAQKGTYTFTGNTASAEMTHKSTDNGNTWEPDSEDFSFSISNGILTLDYAGGITFNKQN